MATMNRASAMLLHSMGSRIYQCLALCFFMLCSASWAATRDNALGHQKAVAELTSATQHVNLGAHVERWVDPTGRANLGQAQQRHAAGDFKPFPGLPSAGFTLAAHWFKVSVATATDAPNQWVLAIGANYLNDVQVWVPGPPDQQGSWQHHQRGDRFTSEPRPFAARLNAMVLKLPPNQTTDIWVRVQTTSVMNVTLDVWQPTAYAANETTISMLYVGLVVLLFLVVVVMALLGVGMKDRVFLSFAAYMSTLAVIHFCHSGALQMMWPLRPWWASDILVGYGALGAFPTANFLWIELLNLRDHFKRMAQVLKWSGWVVIALIPFMATDLYSAIGNVVYMLSIPLGLFTLYASISLWLLRKQTLNLLYLLAFSSSTLGTWSILGMLTGLLPRSDLTTATYPVSIAVTAMIMTGAMVLRIIRIQQEKNTADQANEMSKLRMDNQRRFVAMLTHEFRNPLAGIDRTANLLQAMPEQSVQDINKRLGGIRTQVGRLNTLVDSFLMSESADTLALKPSLAVVNMADYLRERQQAVSPEQQVRIRTDLQPAQLVANIDKRLLSLAIQNLLDNALRYAPNDTPVTLSARSEQTDERRWLIMEVSDEGAGVPEAELAMLGTPYYRAASAMGHQGTGLGYHFCQQIAQAHGGSLKARNREGGGLVVTIRLPQ
jgi:two-component system, sensor histidine kinase LadS